MPGRTVNGVPSPGVSLSSARLGWACEHGGHDLFILCLEKLRLRCDQRVFIVLVSLSQVLASWLNLMVPSRILGSLFYSIDFLSRGLLV